MYTSKAFDLGRGGRSNPMEGLAQFTPGPGNNDIPGDFDNPSAKGFQ